MFSFVVPLDENRLELFKVTKRLYDRMPQKKEFIIPTRSEKVVRNYFKKYRLGKDVKIIPYTLEKGFNCSRALNIGVRNVIYDSVIITSPEVKPLTPVLEQFEEVLGTNVIGQVWDQNENGDRGKSLVNTRYRNKNPGMYFLAMFNKADIGKINGWDEQFLRGYAYEDKDFGGRWVRAGLPFVIRDDIQGLHQWHPRAETISGGLSVNRKIFVENEVNEVIKCKLGLVQ